MTFLELKDYVRERLGIPTSDTSRNTQITRLINDEYSRMCFESEATLGTAAVTFTNAVATVTLGVTVVKVKSIFTATGFLEPITPARFAFYAGSFTGANAPTAPRYYLVLDGTTALVIRLWPTPTATDATPLAFVVVKPTALAADANVPTSIPDGWHVTLGERVTEQVALMEDKTELAREARGNIDRGMATLLQHVRDRNGELLGTFEAGADVGAPMPQVLGQGARR